jgi:nanoRNase/pAp phosphatase (c-di-AMP/oligoRNAs hydrolase)
VDNPDGIAEMADLFLRLEGVDWTLTHGSYQGKVWISLRTSQTSLNAADVMKKMIAGIGTGGGHETSAGGQIPLAKGTQAELQAVQKNMSEKFLRAIGAKQNKVKKLVSSSRSGK